MRSCQIQERECGLVQSFLLDDEGATAIEYALLAALIGVVVVGSTSSLGSAITKMYTLIESTYPDP